MRRILLLLTLLLVNGASVAGAVSDHYFTNREGLRLHYLEAGSGPQTIVFIPGWLMPAAVFRLQLESLGGEFRVLAFDPRSQGKSEIFNGEHSIERRMDDMEDFLSAAGVKDYVLAGWSLGVMESLDFIDRKPQRGLRGLVLIDNSIGEANPPAPRKDNFYQNMRDPKRRPGYLRNFCLSLFGNPPPGDIASAVLSSALQMPARAAIQLISPPYPRIYWRDIVAKQQVPVLYAITPHLREQGAALLQRKGELAQVEVFAESGHALFVDDPTRFNATTAAFARRCFISAAGRGPGLAPALPETGGGQAATSVPRNPSGN